LIAAGFLLIVVGCADKKSVPPKEKAITTFETLPVALPRVTSIWVTRQHGDGKFRMVEAFGSWLHWEFIEPRVSSDPLLYMVQWRLEDDVQDGEWKWSLFMEEVSARCTALVCRDATGTSIRCTVNFYDRTPPPVFVFSLAPIFMAPPSLTFRFWPGDVTQDGIVNSNDRAIVKFYSGKELMHCVPALSDLNMDGCTNSGDRALVKYYSGTHYTR